MVVRRGGGAVDCLYRIGVYLRLFEQLAHGTLHEIRCARTLFGFQYVARLHADALHYPLITGVYHVRQFIVVEDIVRYIASHTGDHCVYLFHWGLYSLSLCAWGGACGASAPGRGCVPPEAGLAVVCPVSLRPCVPKRNATRELRRFSALPAASASLRKSAGAGLAATLKPLKCLFPVRDGSAAYSAVPFSMASLPR